VAPKKGSPLFFRMFSKRLLFFKNINFCKKVGWSGYARLLQEAGQVRA
jgi:hypothetical protein